MARTLGLSMDPILAAQDIVTGREFPIDVGAFGENRWFVYVAAFAPATGESVFELSAVFPGSTLGDALYALPRTDGTTDLRILRNTLVLGVLVGLVGTAMTVFFVAGITGYLGEGGTERAAAYVLPIGLAENVRLRRDVKQGEPIPEDAVDLEHAHTPVGVVPPSAATT